MATTTPIIYKQARYFTSKPSRFKYIINAKTGVKYNFNFNSHESKSLYHVIDSTGVYDKDGFKRNRKINYINEPNHLFYDSPEQYKLHHGSNLSASNILKWHENQMLMNTELLTDTDRYNADDNENFIEIK
jgi:hypothetical protein